MTRCFGNNAALLSALALLVCAPAIPARAQIVITDTTDATTLVQTIVGQGVTVVGTPTLIGRADKDGAQQGTFTSKDASLIGFNEGIVLTSGLARNVVGPNINPGITKTWIDSKGNSAPGDPDLDTLVKASTFDANVLEFDFRVNPDNPIVGIDFVFASEEYNEFINAEVNDVFAFYVDGTNVALVPGTNTSINVDTINRGETGTGEGVNGQYFRNNEFGFDEEGNFIPSPLNTEMDGLTTVLTANVGSALDPNRDVHHIKLAIADTGDDVLDSAVFIRRASFAAVPGPSALATALLGAVPGVALLLRRRRR